MLIKLLSQCESIFLLFFPFFEMAKWYCYKYSSKGRHWQNNPSSVKCWASDPCCMGLYHLAECTVNLIVAGSVGSPIVILCVLHIEAFPMCTDAAIFLCLKLYNVFNCFPILVTSLPLEVWSTEESSLRKVFYYHKKIFLYFSARTDWRNVTFLIREDAHFFTSLSR